MCLFSFLRYSFYTQQCFTAAVICLVVFLWCTSVLSFNKSNWKKCMHSPSFFHTPVSYFHISHSCIFPQSLACRKKHGRASQYSPRYVVNDKCVGRDVVRDVRLCTPSSSSNSSSRSRRVVSSVWSCSTRSSRTGLLCVRRPIWQPRHSLPLLLSRTPTNHRCLPVVADCKSTLKHLRVL